MEWVPIFLITLKITVFSTGMFFSIKWHYDQDRKKKEEAGKAQAPAEHTPEASDQGVSEPDGGIR